MNANERKAEQSKLNSLEIIAQLYRGELPMDLEVKTQFITGLLGFEHSISSGQALLITVARRDNFKDDKVWASWCENKFDFNASHRCHMVQAGRLLLDTIKKIDLFQLLFKLEMYKLIALERIDRLDLPEFLAANDVAALNRDQVRDAVNAWLGCEEPAAKGGNTADRRTVQPDLFDLLGNACALGPESIIKAIDNTAKALQACDSGLILYGCSLEYFKSNPGTLSDERMAEFEVELEDELKTLRAMRAQAAGFKLKSGAK